MPTTHSFNHLQSLYDFIYPTKSDSQIEMEKIKRAWVHTLLEEIMLTVTFREYVQEESSRLHEETEKKTRQYLQILDEWFSLKEDTQAIMQFNFEGTIKAEHHLLEEKESEICAVVENACKNFFSFEKNKFELTLQDKERLSDTLERVLLLKTLATGLSREKLVQTGETSLTGVANSPKTPKKFTKPNSPSQAKKTSPLRSSASQELARENAAIENDKKFSELQAKNEALQKELDKKERKLYFEESSKAEIITENEELQIIRQTQQDKISTLEKNIRTEQSKRDRLERALNAQHTQEEKQQTELKETQKALAKAKQINTQQLNNSLKNLSQKMHTIEYYIAAIPLFILKELMQYITHNKRRLYEEMEQNSPIKHPNQLDSSEASLNQTLSSPQQTESFLLLPKGWKVCAHSSNTLNLYREDSISFKCDTNLSVTFSETKTKLLSTYHFSFFVKEKKSDAFTLKNNVMNIVNFLFTQIDAYPHANIKILSQGTTSQCVKDGLKFYQILRMKMLSEKEPLVSPNGQDALKNYYNTLEDHTPTLFNLYRSTLG